MAPDPSYRVFNHEVCLDQWADRENPPAELRILVANWLIARMDDPHQGMRRVPDFPNMWFGKVARSDHGGAVVVCTYEIHEADRAVHVKSIATLNKPA